MRRLALSTLAAILIVTAFSCTEEHTGGSDSGIRPLSKLDLIGGRPCTPNCDLISTDGYGTWPYTFSFDLTSMCQERPMLVDDWEFSDGNKGFGVEIPQGYEPDVHHTIVAHYSPIPQDDFEFEWAINYGEPVVDNQSFEFDTDTLSSVDEKGKIDPSTMTWVSVKVSYGSSWRRYSGWVFIYYEGLPTPW